MTKLFRELVLHRYMKASLELVDVQQATAKLAKAEVFCLLPAASWRNRADGEMNFPVNAVSSDPDCKFPTPPELSSLFSTNLICLKKISMCFQRELVWNWYVPNTNFRIWECGQFFALSCTHLSQKLLLQSKQKARLKRVPHFPHVELLAPAPIFLHLYCNIIKKVPPPCQKYEAAGTEHTHDNKRNMMWTYNSFLPKSDLYRTVAKNWISWRSSSHRAVRI